MYFDTQIFYKPQLINKNELYNEYKIQLKNNNQIIFLKCNNKDRLRARKSLYYARSIGFLSEKLKNKLKMNGVLIDKKLHIILDIFKVEPKTHQEIQKKYYTNNIALKNKNRIKTKIKYYINQNREIPEKIKIEAKHNNIFIRVF